MSISFRSSSPRPLRGATKAVSDDTVFIPQAILRASIVHISEITGVPIEKSLDDLDEFDGVTYFRNDMPFPIAIRHYAGHPAETVTIYLPYGINEIDFITGIVGEMVEALHLPFDAIIWQRKDNPEL